MNQPFIQVALPMMVTFVAAIWAASWAQNKRLEEISKRLDDVVARLARIEDKLSGHDSRISVLESAKWR